MRYIEKLEAPQSFINKTSGLNSWNDYHICCNRQKRALRKYILKYEQNNLCIYCESKISSSNDSSHIEHIKPKASNMYPELTFEYTNLVVSCNGNCHNEDNDNSRHTCGHIKYNEYDENKFLNPVEVIDMRDYFKYYDYKIEPSSKDNNRAKYMIDILHLNNGELLQARKKALKNFIRKMNAFQSLEEKEEKIREILKKENIAFISFLKFKYSQV
jgi:uncharacterized protein (TIGR02646 family)